jgi:hypothetical protein
MSHPQASAIVLEGSSGHNRFQNLEVRSFAGSGIVVSGNGENTHNEFLGLEVHDTALGPEGEGHGIRIEGSDNLVDGGEWHDIDGAAGLSRAIWLGSGEGGADRNVVRNARIHDNQFGIFLGGDDNLVYNNLLYGNLNVPVEIESPAGADPGGEDVSERNAILNNTVFGNGGPALRVGIARVTRIVNNILWSNGIDVIADGGIHTVIGSNLALDPRFSDEEAEDLRLTPASPAVDAGTALPEVPEDHDGRPRPLGGGFDIGAYEYPGSEN